MSIADQLRMNREIALNLQCKGLTIERDMALEAEAKEKKARLKLQHENAVLREENALMEDKLERTVVFYQARRPGPTERGVHRLLDVTRGLTDEISHLRKQVQGASAFLDSKPESMR